jgi:hypothetical protein
MNPTVPKKILASTLGANPTMASYYVSVVNFFTATGSLARFENKKYFILF